MALVVHIGDVVVIHGSEAPESVMDGRPVVLLPELYGTVFKKPTVLTAHSKTIFLPRECTCTIMHSSMLEYSGHSVCRNFTFVVEIHSMSLDIS